MPFKKGGHGAKNFRCPSYVRQGALSTYPSTNTEKPSKQSTQRKGNIYKKPTRARYASTTFVNIPDDNTIFPVHL